MIRINKSVCYYSWVGFILFVAYSLFIAIGGVR